jgi:hypothetical protein
MTTYVPFPDEHASAALEFALSLHRAPASAEPPPAPVRAVPRSGEDVPEPYARLRAAVNEAARELLDAVALTPDVELTYGQLRKVSGVEPGGAMMSIGHACERLGVAAPIEKRRNSRDNGRYAYSMRSDVAAAILAARRESGAPDQASTPR